jgi:hypothetical protein
MKPRYLTRYRYDTIPIRRYGKIFKIPDTIWPRYVIKKIKFKINSISAQCINITKNDNKQTFKLMKMIKTSGNYIFFPHKLDRI